jgi:hypothetical protein
MPTGTAVRVYDIIEGDIQGGFYKITVRFGGRKVKEYVERTKLKAFAAFERDGFQLVAWAEGKRIVLRGE